MFKTEASKTRSGNWNVEASCQKNHTSFKNQYRSGDDYKCPYCGLDVY